MLIESKSLPSLLNKIYQRSYIYEPINKPTDHIISFFECAWLSNHLVMLKYWNKVVSTKACYDQKNCPADLIYTHKMCCNLINAAWLINQLNMEPSLSLQTLPDKAQQEYLYREKLMLRDYPTHLSEQELLNPYLAVQNFFKAFKLKTIHQQLQLWLNEGLSPFSYIEDHLAIRKVYRHLRRLCEASWLIHERELKRHTQELYDEVANFKAVQPLTSVIELLTKIIPVHTIYNLSTDAKSPDLIIVLDKFCNKAYAEFEPLIELTMLGFDQSFCTVHNYGHLRELINKGHLFYSVACNAANIVYQQQEDPFMQIGEQHLAWAKKEAAPLFDSCMAKAVYFYNGAQHYLAQEVNYMAVFMLQQACELTYRCLLKVLRGKDIKCHAPSVLRKYVRRYAPEIIGIFAINEEEEIEYLKVLEDAYIKSRYDQHYTIELPLLQFLNEKVGLLQQVAIQSFNNKIEILENAAKVG